MINTKKNRKNLYMEMDKKDIITKVKPLLASGSYMLRAPDGLMVPTKRAIFWDGPWVYVKHDDINRCDLAHELFFNHLDIVPKACRECYKIVVRPKTVEDLFNLYELQKELDYPSKCGIEPRRTVNGHYGGYFYNRGVEEGRERYQEVRKAVDEKMIPETDVILKRYCTEFELKFGPSNELPEMTLEEEQMEEYIRACIEPYKHFSTQPDFLVASTFKKWLHYAYENGDETYLKFTNGERLFPKLVTYHEEEKINGKASP